VQTVVSAISPGTELLIYRGRRPRTCPSTRPSPPCGRSDVPAQVWLCRRGRVIAVGSRWSAWQGRLGLRLSAAWELFSQCSDRPASGSRLFHQRRQYSSPLWETAVNFFMMGNPSLGSGCWLFGQGVVGLLTTALLVRMPLSRLITADRYPSRRERSRELGRMLASMPAG